MACLQQIDRTPKTANGQHCRDARPEEAPVNVVLQSFFVHIGARWVLDFGSDFPEQFIHVGLMHGREERQRFARAMFSATSFQAVLVEDAPRIGTTLHNFRHAGVFADLANRHGFCSLQEVGQAYERGQNRAMT